MKLAVIYHSETGNTKKAAEFVRAGMEKVEGVEARAFSIDAVDEAFVSEAGGVIFGAPHLLRLCLLADGAVPADHQAAPCR